MQCESHGVYNRSFWGEKTTEEIDGGSLFFFFFFLIVIRVSLIQTDGTCLRARWQMLAITSPIIINGRPWLMGLWLPLHYGMSLPSFLRGELE